MSASRHQLKQDTATIEPLVIDSRTFAALLQTSKSTLFRRLALGEVLKPAAQFGQQPRWNLAEVRAWIAEGMPRADVWEARRRQAGA